MAEKAREQPDNAPSHLANCNRSVSRRQIRVEIAAPERQLESSIREEVLPDIRDVVLLFRTGVDELIRPGHLACIAEKGGLVYGDTEEIRE